MQIKIDEKLSDYIEALQYEKERTNEIMAFMLSHDYDIHTDAFKKWNKENQEAYIKYQEAKAELEEKYIRPLPQLKNQKVNWTLNFETKTLEVADAKAD